MPDYSALRDALSHMRIESPEGIPFEAALARENGWSPAFAERVADEYCGFLYLAATAGFEVTPSQAVDQAWHLHLSWPHYRDVLCARIVGRPIEHRPGTGEPDEEDRYRGQYERTLALYEETFGKPPPDDIWPRPAAGEAGPDARRRGRSIGVCVAAAALAFGLATAASGWAALALATVGTGLLLSSVITGLGVQPAPNRRKDGRCGAAGCGGGSADCGGGCGGD